MEIQELEKMQNLLQEASRHQIGIKRIYSKMDDLLVGGLARIDEEAFMREKKGEAVNVEQYEK